MIPYSQMGSRPIMPYNLYTYTSDAKRYFIARFGDELSFNFLHYLIRYCNVKNQGNWPELITPEIISIMSEDARTPIIIDEIKACKDGYIINHGEDYELTHEFIVASFMTCSDGNFLPISTGHIDFTKTKELAKFLNEEIFIQEPEAVTFLVELVKYMSTKQGVLMGREFSIDEMRKIAKDNNLILVLCIDWAVKSNLVAINDEDVICNGLIFSAYYSMPRLS